MNSNLIITSIVSELPKVKGEIYEYRIDGGRILSKATFVLNDAVRLQQIADQWLKHTAKVSQTSMTQVFGKMLWTQQ